MNVKPVYLIFVDAEFGVQGHNKFYSMTPQGDTFLAKWGRVGGSESSKVYPMSKWDSTISSKIKKGYVDRSDLMSEYYEDNKEDTGDENAEFNAISNDSVRDIIKRLYDYANKVIQASYTVGADVVTQAMVDAAQEFIDTLSKDYNTLTADEFNKVLNKLFITIPRKMTKVSDYLAVSDKDFIDIIKREQDLLDTMRGQVYKKVEKPKVENNEEQQTISMLDKMGITMEDATEEDVAKIKKAMGDAAGKFYKAWRVSNKETEEKYQKFVKENNIGNIKLTCHGSRNQNWFNILKTGLKIRPSCAIYTGSLLGDAIYYSNPDIWHGVAKSIGYTSLGGYWTRDYQNCGFIAFFETALGKSYDIYSHDNKYHDFNLKKLKEADPDAWSLFLHGSGHSGWNTVINDEITIYDERQTTVRYLVEIR